ncbi:MAG: hypothetical protein ACLQVI_36150 [Polyangiaceae bacterium]
MLGDRRFFQPDARARVTATIKEIEAETSAEVVVAVRKASGSYRDIDYLFGFVVSFAGLLLLLFHPHPFAIEGMPLDVLAAFLAGALFSANAPPLRRALLRRARMETSCRDAARAAFVELGVGRTTGRNGILVLVSVFERRVSVVGDVGIDAGAMGAEWATRIAALESSLAGGASVDRFVTALRALAPPLAAAMPHRPDDVNELPDEVAE